VEIARDRIYIFKELLNAYQAAILSQSPNAHAIIDYITEVAR